MHCIYLYDITLYVIQMQYIWNVHTRLIAILWMFPLDNPSFILPPLPPLWNFLYSNNGNIFCFDAFLIDYLFWTMNLSVLITGYLWHCKMNCIKWLHCAISSRNEIRIKIYETCLKFGGFWLTGSTGWNTNTVGVFSNFEFYFMHF